MILCSSKHLWIDTFQNASSGFLGDLAKIGHEKKCTKARDHINLNKII